MIDSCLKICIANFFDALFKHIGRLIQNAKTLYEEICQPSVVKLQPMRVKL